MGRYPHDGSGSVSTQHVISDPNRHLLPIDRVDRNGTGGHPTLRTVFVRPFIGGQVIHQIPERLHSVAMLGGGDQIHQWMLRGQHHITDAKERVCPSREHGDGGVLMAHHLKIDFCTFRTADPVRLHGPHPFRPAIQQGQVIKQSIGIVGDLEKPLAQIFLFHQSP